MIIPTGKYFYFENHEIEAQFLMRAIDISSSPGKVIFFFQGNNNIHLYCTITEAILKIIYLFICVGLFLDFLLFWSWLIILLFYLKF